jgi:hypothetical protein
MPRVFTSLVGVLVLSVGVAAQKPAPVKGPLATAVSLRCTFSSFVATEWKDGVPTSVVNPQDFSFQIETINLKKKTARIVFGPASAAASAFLTSTGLNVIETTALGNFLMTTVFVAGAQGNTLQAVHSRHLGDLNALGTAFQHYGTCNVIK